jgi:uroporphyrinogen-III synthase
MSKRAPILLLTRPRPAALAFAESLQRACTVVVSPLLKIVPMEAVPKISTDTGAIFTSQNGVILDGAGRNAWCVGARTTEVARARHWNARCAGSNADALVTYLLTNPPKQPMVHFRGVHTRGEVCKRLKDNGLSVTEQIAYDQVAQPLTADARAVLDGSTPVIVPLFSPRSAALFSSIRPGSAPLTLVAMSQDVGDAVMKIHYDRLEIAGKPTAESMRAIIEKCLDDITLG